MQSEAVVSTEQANSYMQRLSRHFAHKIPVEMGDAHATIQFAMGTCALQVEGNTLHFRANAAEAAALERVKDVIGSHFQRFAFREELNVAWQDMANA